MKQTTRSSTFPDALGSRAPQSAIRGFDWILGFGLLVVLMFQVVVLLRPQNQGATPADSMQTEIITRVENAKDTQLKEIADVKSAIIELKSSLIERLVVLDAVQQEFPKIHGVIDPLRTDLNELLRKVTDLDSRIQGMESALNEVRGAHANLKDDFGNLRDKIASLHLILDDIKGQLTSLANSQRDTDSTSSNGSK